jgi:hypothetical protein
MQPEARKKRLDKVKKVDEQARLKVCLICEIMGIKFEAISSEILETHVVNRHHGCNIFHQPDIDKFKAEYEARQQKSKEGYD